MYAKVGTTCKALKGKEEKGINWHGIAAMKILLLKRYIKIELVKSFYTYESFSQLIQHFALCYFKVPLMEDHLRVNPPTMWKWTI